MHIEIREFIRAYFISKSDQEESVNWSIYLKLVCFTFQKILILLREPEMKLIISFVKIDYSHKP